MPEATDTSLTVLTPVFGDEYEDFLAFWEASLRRVIPQANVLVHRCDYDPKDKLFGVPAHRGDLAKMEHTHLYKNLLTTDVDTIFVAPFVYKPSSPDILVAMPVKWMIPETDPEMEAEEWGTRMLWRIHERVGLANVEPVTIHPWAIWSSGDLMPHFKREISGVTNALSKERFGDRYPFTVAVLSVMWRRLKKEGRAEAMPGGCVFHLPVYPLPRRLEIAEAIWKKITDADKAD